jgi:glucuronate isomerase
MQHEFSDRFDGFDDADVKASAERFEEMLKSKETIFFDEETYEQLSEYYLLKSKWDMAMTACRIGLQQYPYSLELLLDKVQLHANYEQFGEAMEVLDTASTYNPADNEIIATMIGNFNDGSIAGKVQFGSGWWFLDQKDGMEKQINTLSNMGLLSRFIGMLTDSRSFLSFPRHEYFRRILCNILGNDIENGEIPNDIKWTGQIVQNICYYNAKDYFDF